MRYTKEDLEHLIKTYKIGENEDGTYRVSLNMLMDLLTYIEENKKLIYKLSKLKLILEELKSINLKAIAMEDYNF